jgi:predicted phosphodiesterase
MAKVFIWGDPHFPYNHKEAQRQAIAFIKKQQPDVVINIGDLYDQYSFSKYSRTLNLTTPERELRQAMIGAMKMWNQIQEVASKAKCYQLKGNHDMRMKKRIAERLPEFEGFSKDVYKFFNVKTLKDDRSYLIIDGVVYCHGWLSKSIDHARHFNRPTVHGHRHRPAIETAGRLWSMDVGFMGDEKKLPFNYTTSKVTNWRVSCGLVVDGKPQLIFLGDGKK